MDVILRVSTREVVQPKRLILSPQIFDKEKDKEKDK
jgi:hypothetical protein